MQRELLIVGAGLTGSLTASLLAKSSARVKITVWDKARGSGGRFTTSHHDDDLSLHVDLGAQYISTTDEKVKGHVYKELLDSSILTPFHGTIEGGRHTEGCVHYVAPGGMSSVCKHFLTQSQASVAYKHCVNSLSVRDGCVSCSTEAGGEGRFNGLVLTLPAPQLLRLEGGLLSNTEPGVLTALSSVKYSSRYALGLFYNLATVSSSPGAFASPWTAKYWDHPVVRYTCWDQLKRGVLTQQSGATLLVHTSVPFGIEHLEDETEEVRTLVCRVVDELIPGLPPPTHSRILRWRYSQVREKFPGSHGFIVLSHDPLVIATGDSFSGSNFDNCLRAALATSNHIVQCYK